MLERINGAIAVFESIAEFVARIALVLMLMTITIDAVGRYFLKSPLPGSNEFVEMYLMAAVVFLSWSKLQSEGGHLRVEMFFNKLPAPIRKAILFLSFAAASPILAVISWKAFGKAWFNLSNGMFGQGIVPFPLWVGWAFVSVGAGIFAVRLLFDSVRVLANDYPMEASHSDPIE